MEHEVSTNLIVFIVLVFTWELAWKGWALWRASQRQEKEIYIALLVLNTLGLFPMVYLYITRGEKSRSRRSTS